jgi:regulator of sigma E protease
VAKWLGIKVEEFGYGFPPKVWGKKFGETLYSINLLPIGGFVKLYGEDDAGGGKVNLGKGKEQIAKSKKDEGRAFYARPVWQRAAVVVAGVVMNTVLAILIYYVYMGISGFKAELPLLGNHQFFAVNQKNIAEIIISDVVKGSPAEKAGIPPYAKVIALNGTKVNSIDTFLKIVTENKGKQMTITWQDTKTQQTKTVTLMPRVNVPKIRSTGRCFFSC